ncbi:MAG: MFS transporter [Candidatus Bathyarchaeota archaeon]|nr:MAG: MFS transporter [Candidatus Bathyarchaeota archaeon]
MSKNPVLKPFATSLGAPNDLVGLVASSSTIPGILVSLPAASLSDVFGRRKILMFSAFIFASAPFLYLFVTSWWQLIPVRFYHGFATAIFVPVTEATIAEKFPTKLGERISLFSSVTAAGRATAPFLGGYILFLTDYGYKSLYLAVGIAGVTAFITGLLFLVEQKKTKTQDSNYNPTKGKMVQGWLKVAKNHDLQVVGLIQASQYYVFGSVEFFLVGYLAEVARLDPFSIGVIMGSQVIVLILARPFMGKVSDKIGRGIPIVLGSIISCVILAVFPFSTHFLTLLFLSMMYGLGFATVIASTSPLTCEIVPSNLLGTSLGFLSTLMDVGQTLGPIISGIILATSLQYSSIFFSLSLILIASTIVFLCKVPKT